MKRERLNFLLENWEQGYRGNRTDEVMRELFDNIRVDEEETPVTANKKTLNIIEAREANRTHIVVSPIGSVYKVGSLVTLGEKYNHFPTENVFGQWTVVEQPREVWINEYANGVQIVCQSLEQAEKMASIYNASSACARTSSRKFREVLDDEA